MSDDKALKLLNHIGNELKLLWWQMEAWQELFDIEQQKRQALIQTTAPGFFSIVQVTLAESILLRIARLMDPPKSAGQENSTIRNLGETLSGDSQDSLPSDIRSLTEEWSKKDSQTKDEQGKYARLKVLRNKWLAHNDWLQRRDQSSNSLWIPLTHDDFSLAQGLAGSLWSIYRKASRIVRGTDVVEPQHSCLDNRASMVLKRLCESQYLDCLLDGMPDDARFHKLAGLQAFEQENMGQDRIQHVFSHDKGSQS